MPLDRLGDGLSGPICFWPDFPHSVSPLPVQSVHFSVHSCIAGISPLWTAFPCSIGLLCLLLVWVPVLSWIVDSSAYSCVVTP
jgi:hypothetical protein